MNLANQPMEEMKVAAFAIFESVSSHEWGQKILTQNTKFLDYILNRTTESTHAGKVRNIHILEYFTSYADRSIVDMEIFYCSSVNSDAKCITEY